MLFKTSDNLRNQLLKRPESGMGYQIGFVDGDRYAIFNADIATTLIHLPFHLPLLLPEADVKSQIDPRSPVSDNGMYRLRLVPIQQGTDEPRPPHCFAFAKKNSKVLADFARKLLASESPASPIQDMPTLDGDLDHVETHNSYRSNAGPGELFVRYSAFPNDRRINPDGSVRPGTYATTQSDSAHVPSGLAAVARYALPNPTPAVHRFVLSPPAQTRIHCGTVTPQFGQAGGGVEVRFDNSLQPGTASGPQSIPER